MELSKEERVEKFNKTALKLLKLVLSEEENLEVLVNEELTKALKIAAKKEEFKNVDEAEQMIALSNIRFSLEMVIEILNKCVFPNISLVSQLLVELSYWDNCRVVFLSCSIFKKVFSIAVSHQLPWKFFLEKVIDYFYLRRLKEMYNFLGNETHDKLASLELILASLCYLVEREQFIPITFSLFDRSDVYFNLNSALIDHLLQYFNLQHKRFNFLKELILRILQGYLKELSTFSNFQDSNSEKREQFKAVQKACKEPKFKLIKDLPLSSAKPIALYLRYSKEIQIDTMFEIIGRKEELSKAIIQEYSNTFDFKGLSIIEAYRQFLSTFKLTGESFNIENIITSFSDKFHSDTQYLSSEACFILCYSIIMLITDLTNDNVKENMTQEQFTNNLMKAGFDYDPKELKAIYADIRDYPVRLAKPREAYSKLQENFEELERRMHIEERFEGCFSLVDQLGSLKVVNSFSETDKQALYSKLTDKLIAVKATFYQGAGRLLEQLIELGEKGRIELLSSISRNLFRIANVDNVESFRLFFSSLKGNLTDLTLFNELFYPAVKTILVHKLRSQDLSENYLEFIKTTLKDTFAFLKRTGKMDKPAESSILSMFKNSEQYSLEEYEKMVVQAYDLGYAQVDFDISLSEQLNMIKHAEELVVMFVFTCLHHITDEVKDSIYCIILLNELLSDETTFKKVWKNMLNLMKNKLEFKEISSNKTACFEMLIVHHYFLKIAARFAEHISQDDFGELLDCLTTADSADVLFRLIKDVDGVLTKSAALLNRDNVLKYAYILKGMFVSISRELNRKEKNLDRIGKYDSLLEFTSNFVSKLVSHEAVNDEIIAVFLEITIDFRDVATLYNLIKKPPVNLKKCLSDMFLLSFPDSESSKMKWKLYQEVVNVAILSSNVNTGFLSLVGEFLEVQLPEEKFESVQNLLNMLHTEIIYRKGDLLKHQEWEDILKICQNVMTLKWELKRKQVLWNLISKKILLILGDKMRNKKEDKLDEPLKRLYETCAEGVFVNRRTKGECKENLHALLFEGY